MAKDFILGKKSPPYGGDIKNRTIFIYVQYANNQLEYQFEISLKRFNAFRRKNHKPKLKPQELAKLIYNEFADYRYSGGFVRLIYWAERFRVLPVQVSNKARLSDKSFLLANVLGLYILKHKSTPNANDLWQWLGSDFTNEWECQRFAYDLGYGNSLLEILDKPDKHQFFIVEENTKPSLLDLMGKQFKTGDIRFKRYHSDQGWIHWDYVDFYDMYSKKVRLVERNWWL